MRYPLLMLADIGAKYCMSAIQQRRQYHGEDDMLINARSKALLKRASPPSSASASLEQREMDPHYGVCGVSGQGCAQRS